MFRLMKLLTRPSACVTLSCFNKLNVGIINNSLMPTPVCESRKLKVRTNQEILSRTFASPKDEPRIKMLFPDAEFAYVPGASHWLYVEKPPEFIDKVAKFIEKDPTLLEEDVEYHPNGTPVVLKYQKYKEVLDDSKSSIPVIILHGLLGSKQNWNSIAGQLNRKIGRPVYTLDARNHGDSPHTELFTYELMMCDVMVFMRCHDMNKASIIGHSMGGRTAMLLAMCYPMLVESMIVVDVSPGGPSPNMKGIKQLLDDLNSLKLDPQLSVKEARQEAAKQLKDKIKDDRIIAFLLTNLVEETYKPARCNWRWKFNLDSIRKNVEKEIFNFPIVKLPSPTRTLFLGGADSDYLVPQDEKAIKILFPKAEFSYIEGAGHWVHADKPREFLNIVSDFLNKDPKK